MVKAIDPNVGPVSLLNRRIMVNTMTTQTTTTQTTTTSAPSATIVDEKGNPIQATAASAATTAATTTEKKVVTVTITEAEAKSRAKAEALQALRMDISRRAVEAAQLGASPRMEMRITARNYGEAAKIARFFGDSAAEEAAVVSELADRADIAASSAHWLGGIWGARQLARTSVNQREMLAHQQIKLVGRLNQAGSDLANTLHTLATGKLTGGEK